MDITGKNLTGFSYSSGTGKTFRAFNPSTLEYLEGEFFEASDDDVNTSLRLASGCFPVYSRTTPAKRADFLEAIATEIEALGQTLVARAVAETGLPEGRITGERGRTTGQLRMFANLIREGSWSDAAIETADPGRQPAPKPDLRSMLVPIGPVVVFSASNFPLAFSTAGGDTASALAAGNPVIVKAHPSHPGTSDLVAQAITKAAKATGMPEGVFSHLHDTGFATGERLVKHPFTAAVGFTGSFTGGKALFDIASRREKPIPLFAEMGSTNPVFLFEEALKKDAVTIAAQLAASVTLGAGQFCTKPGLIIARNGSAYDQFENSFVEQMGKVQAATLLNERILKNYRSQVEKLKKDNTVTYLIDAGLVSLEPGLKARPVAAKATAKQFIANKRLHEELFGPFALIIVCDNDSEYSEVAAILDGQLTLSVFATPGDIQANGSLINLFREKAGRLVYNGVPTGVEVNTAMQHGGPFPSTTDSRFTSVGTRAILRFVRPVSFQNWPDEALPAELRNANPMGIMRKLNGSFTREAIR